VNLAVNGRDAMSGGGTLTIATQRRPDGVRLTVADTGSGMEEAVVRKAFDPFFTTKPTGSGTGLGLATVYGIVMQAGGSVSIESKVGRGTSVVIDLPATDSVAIRPPEAGSPALAAGSGETILLVEDDDQLRGVAQRILEASGYRVVQASGGERAIEIVARGKTVDLLLTDVVMPGMSGVELNGHLRLIQPDLRVLYMSGYTSGIGGPDSGSSLADLIEKPFAAADLLARVQAVLHDDAAPVPLS
jgi:two-component system cell cycle sensor histidine kinase/response regulator CckA